jgi:tripartite-type tricarboxylate transporter receptor subunit TctC
MRKTRLALSVLAINLSWAPAVPAQENYPTRVVRLVVPSSPGGGTDTSARLISPKLAALLGQQVVVENRPGASAMLGTEYVARAAPDGYTLLIGQSTMTIVPSTFKKVGFDPIKDFSPVSMVVVVPQVLVGHPSLPAKNTRELIALAKARPGQLDYAAGGVGGNSHMSMALLLNMTGTSMSYVPFKSGNAGLMEALSGRVPLMMGNVLVLMPHVRAGKFRAFGVTSETRSTGVPDVPTLAETGIPGYHAVQWFGILAPAGTPRDIVTRLHRDIVKVMQEEDTRKRFVADGGEPTYSKTPEEFSGLLRTEMVKWAKVAKAAKIEPQ